MPRLRRFGPVGAGQQSRCPAGEGRGLDVEGHCAPRFPPADSPREHLSRYGCYRLCLTKIASLSRHRARRSHSPFVSEISLSGGEITILKTIGVSGSSMRGAQLIDRLDQLEPAELVDDLEGLMAQDYVLCDRVNVRTIDDVKSASFRVNPAHARDLKDAIFPSRKQPERRRRRG